MKVCYPNLRLLSAAAIGPDSMFDVEDWMKVGEPGLDKMLAKSDPFNITFGELAEKYLAQYPFNKQSTKDLYEQITRNLLIPRWSDAIAIRLSHRS
jgi:hypothetical protein